MLTCKKNKQRPEGKKTRTLSDGEPRRLASGRRTAEKIEKQKQKLGLFNYNRIRKLMNGKMLTFD